jgi:hypothetical protein
MTLRSSALLTDAVNIQQSIPTKVGTHHSAARAVAAWASACAGVENEWREALKIPWRTLQDSESRAEKRSAFRQTFRCGGG